MVLDDSGSMTTGHIQPHYSEEPNDNFIWWLQENNYPVPIEWELPSSSHEDWIEEIATEIQEEVIDKL